MLALLGKFCLLLVFKNYISYKEIGIFCNQLGVWCEIKVQTTSALGQTCLTLGNVRMSACLHAKKSIRRVLVCNVSSMKQLGVFYFSIGRDASPLQGYL